MAKLIWARNQVFATQEEIDRYNEVALKISRWE